MKQTVLVIFLLLLPVTSSGVIIDRIAAVVNDEVIALSEIDEAEYMLFNKTAEDGKGKTQNFPNRKKVKEQILERFIEKKLQLQEAKKLKITATPENIDNAIDEIKNKNDIPGDWELEEALKLQGLTLKDLRQQIAERIKITKLINRKVRAKVQVNEDEIRDYYQNHLPEFRLREEIHARHILIQVPDNASPKTVQESRLRIEEVADNLKSGIDFAETAKKLSEAPDAVNGGDLGYFKRGKMISEIDRVVFALQPGQRSDVVRTPFGFHIFEVIERKEHTIDNDPGLRKEIQNRIVKKKTDERLKKFMEELKEKAYINIPKGS